MAKLKMSWLDSKPNYGFLGKYRDNWYWVISGKDVIWSYKWSNVEYREVIMMKVLVDILYEKFHFIK